MYRSVPPLFAYALILGITFFAGLALFETRKQLEQVREIYRGIERMQTLGA